MLWPMAQPNICSLRPNQTTAERNTSVRVCQDGWPSSPYISGYCDNTIRELDFLPWRMELTLALGNEMPSVDGTVVFSIAATPPGQRDEERPGTNQIRSLWSRRESRR